VSPPVAWDDFAAAVAEIAQQPPDRVTRDARVVEDLALDSVALAELVVLLIDDYEVAGVARALDETAWSRLTLGRIFDDHLSAAAR
jgi:acyl carrier protein